METVQLPVIHEDNHLLVVNKPNNTLVQGDSTGDISLNNIAIEYLRVKYNKPGRVFCGVVHRLDRPVSGLVVFAKTSKALERMNKLFAERQIEKTYWALVDHRPPEDEGTLEHWIIKDSQKNHVRAYTRKVPDSKLAKLSYKILGKVNSYLLEVKLQTGRPHQIRVQLAKMGCPIKGDLKYGHPQKSGDNSIYLHARQLSFIHPVKKDLMNFTARLPVNDIWRNFEGF